MPPIRFDELFEIRPVSFIEQMMVILLFGGSFFGIKIQYMKVLNMGFCKNAFCQGVEWHDHLEVTTGNPRWLLVHILVLRCQTSFFASFVQCIRPVQFPPFVVWRCKNSFKPTKNCKIVYGSVWKWFEKSLNGLNIF